MMTKRMDLKNLFARVAAEMRDEFEKTREAVGHSGLKGSAHEETVRRFLKDHLPPSLSFGTGEAVDSTGKRSKQMDVVITDTSRTISLHRAGSIRVYPVESVVAVVEVKSRLDVSDLPEIILNMQSLKDLKKGAYYIPGGLIRHTKNVFGEKFDHFPTLYFVFAFESGDLQQLAETLNELQADLPVSKRIDCAVVLDSGVIFNRHMDGQTFAAPAPGSSLEANTTKDSLLLFFLLTSYFLLQAEQPPIRFAAYVPDGII